MEGERMKERNKLPMLVLLMLLSSYFVFYIIALSTVFPSTSLAARDLTEQVSILGLNVGKENGSQVSTENKIQVNETLIFSYALKIDQEQEIEAGDTFRLSLPDAAYLRIQEDASGIRLKNSLTGEAVGQASLTASDLTVSINEFGAKQKELNALQLSIKMKAIKAGSGIDAGGTASGKIPKLEIVESNESSADLIQSEAKVEGTGKLAIARNFEYVIVDQSDRGKPIAYGMTERKLAQKGEMVTVDFYHEKTVEGSFKDKIEGKTEWSRLLKNTHSYLIREVSDPEYTAVITGGIGEGNRYDFQVEKTQVVRFLIINQLIPQGQLSNKLSDVSKAVIPPFKAEKQSASLVKGLEKQTTSVREATAPSSTNSSDKATKEVEGINLTKIDSTTGEKLRGAEFELKNAAGEKMYLRKELITDENGLLHINSLPDGEYSLVEISAPEGYVLDSEPLKFTVSEKDKRISLTKENVKEEGSAPVKKEFPKSSETNEGTSSKQASSSSASSKKQYPGTGTSENQVFTVLGFGILMALWLYRRKK